MKHLDIRRLRQAQSTKSCPLTEPVEGNVGEWKNVLKRMIITLK